MSDNRLSFVPLDAGWMPLADYSNATAMTEAAFPLAEDVRAKVHSAAQFVDQGENFEDVFCPLCNTSLIEHFGELMNDKFDEELGGFEDMQIDAPCCGQATNLNDLVFEKPAAFGRFQIDVMNPDVGEIPAGFLDGLAGELGTPLRIVWCHI